MIAKIMSIFGIVIITGFAAVFLIVSLNEPQDLGGTFVVDAIYYEEQKLVQITFEDTSKQSTSVVMEILGMNETFQKYYEKTSFIEDVIFELPPKYGWKVHPVTFVIEHPELGKIGLKTEIRTPDEPKPVVIYSHL